jgi:hypothetical protein
MPSAIDNEIQILLNLKKYTNEYISLKEIQSHDEKINFPQNPLIKQNLLLLEQVKNRLSHICNHKIVEENIVLFSGDTKTLYYCKICETTFGFNNQK